MLDVVLGVRNFGINKVEFCFERGYFLLEIDYYFINKNSIYTFDNWFLVFSECEILF